MNFGISYREIMKVPFFSSLYSFNDLAAPQASSSIGSCHYLPRLEVRRIASDTGVRGSSSKINRKFITVTLPVLFGFHEKPASEQ